MADEVLAVSSQAVVKDEALAEVWDRRVEFPSPEHMRDLDVVTHVMVERAQRGGYHYLHESSLAFHKGALYCCWANHAVAETNFQDERVRGRRSIDGGLTWGPVEDWILPGGDSGSESYNHPVMCEFEGALWAFVARWEKEKPSTEVFLMDEITGEWRSTGRVIEGFVAFQAPMKMRDGNWIIGGENHWSEAAVMISRGSDFLDWRMVMIPRPEGLVLQYPEVALMDRGDSILAVCRPLKSDKSAPMAESFDCGKTWTPLRFSNFPLGPSQPCAGKLSTGQHFLITNSLEEKRALLTIAVTEPGGRLFSKIWKIRHQTFPRRRLLGTFKDKQPIAFGAVGRGTEWSYPSAVERDGKLYVSYTHGKEDCVMSVVPVSVLA